MRQGEPQLGCYAARLLLHAQVRTEKHAGTRAAWDTSRESRRRRRVDGIQHSNR